MIPVILLGESHGTLKLRLFSIGRLLSLGECLLSAEGDTCLSFAVVRDRWPIQGILNGENWKQQKFKVHILFHLCSYSMCIFWMSIQATNSRVIFHVSLTYSCLSSYIVLMLFLFSSLTAIIIKEPMWSQALRSCSICLSESGIILCLAYFT